MNSKYIQKEELLRSKNKTAEIKFVFRIILSHFSQFCSCGLAEGILALILFLCILS